MTSKTSYPLICRANDPNSLSTAALNVDMMKDMAKHRDAVMIAVGPPKVIKKVQLNV